VLSLAAGWCGGVLSRDGSSTDTPAAVTATPASTGTSTGSIDVAAVVATLEPSVVSIETTVRTQRGPFTAEGEGAGTGVVIDGEGHILTNAHVVEDATSITVTVAGEARDAELVASDTDADIAVLRVDDTSGLVAADLADASTTAVGDEVVAIGNALALEGGLSVTRGIVSALDRSIETTSGTLSGLIQTDAAISSGNSGGPLVNAAGQVVGMNTAIVADAQNLGFSIAIDAAQPIIEALKSGNGAVTPNQAFLGVSSTNVASLTEEARAQFSIDRDEGAFITEVVPASAADDGGLRVGDVIIEIDGAEVATASDVRSVVTDHDPGDEVDVTVLRDGREEDITVTLGRRGDGA
jgi:putative serine protease PepD